MRKKFIITMMIAACFVFVYAQDQADSYLQDITVVVKELRKGNNNVRDLAVEKLSKGNFETLDEDVDETRFDTPYDTFPYILIDIY